MIYEYLINPKNYYMNLETGQIINYNENGYLLIANVFSPVEIWLIRKEMQHVVVEDCSNGLFSRLVRLKRLVDVSVELIGTEVYAHQTKISTKHALAGDWWDWHQDFTFWNLNDGMRDSNVLTAMIFLNDVNEYNGPMLVIPGSHKSTTENTLKQETLAQWVEKKGIKSVKGQAGSVLFFHGNIFYASANNLSPWDQHAFLITYNSVKNALPIRAPIVPLNDKALLDPGMEGTISEKIRLPY